MADDTARRTGEIRGPAETSLVTIGLTLSLGAFVALLDTTIVGVALHSFTDYFDADLSDAQWAATAYLLAMAAVIPVTGWAAGRFGAAASWTASLGVFLIGSILCGLAWSLASLIAFRALQGLGASMLFPLMRIIVVEVAGRERLGRMMSMMAVPLLLAPVVGPVVGGVVIETLSWRWAFLLNVPITLAVIVLSLRKLPNSRTAPAGRLDVIGVLTMGGGITAVIYAFSKLSEGRGVTNGHVVVPLLAGVVLLAVHGLRAMRSSADPVVDFRLFRDRSFSASTTITLLNNFGLYGVVILVPLFFQQAGGASPLGAGLIMVAQGLGTAVAVVLVGRVIDTKSNPRLLVLAGLALVGSGITGFALAGRPEAGVLSLVALFVLGIGLALAASPIMVTLYHSLPGSAVPAATTANAIAQQLGGALGAAVIALLLQHYTHQQADQVAGFHHVFWWALAFVVLTAVPALALPSGPAARS